MILPHLDNKKDGMEVGNVSYKSFRKNSLSTCPFIR